MINIKGIDKAVLLQALFNRSFQQDKGALDPTGWASMTLEKAQNIIEASGEDLYFDYVNGRVMKVQLGEDEMDSWLYNRDLGQGAAEEIVAQIRAANPL